MAQMGESVEFVDDRSRFRKAGFSLGFFRLFPGVSLGSIGNGSMPGKGRKHERNHAVRTQCVCVCLVSRMRREREKPYGSYRPRRSHPSVVTHGDQLSGALCIWRIRLRGHSKSNSHSPGGWEEAKRRCCICYHRSFLDLGGEGLASANADGVIERSSRPRLFLIHTGRT